MNVLVFSDTHLEKTFDEHKFHFLQKIIQKSDVVIINGDLWEGYIDTFEQFIYSPWRHLFPHLKKKQSVYIYGNHDKKWYLDKRVGLFSKIQTERYILKIKHNSYIFEHGHRFSFSIDKIITQKKMLGVLVPLSTRTQRIIIRKFGSKKIKQLFGSLNAGIKQNMLPTLRKNEIFVCGHTHVAEFDLKNRFVNLGTIQHGLGQYLTIHNDIIQLHEEWYL